MVDTQFADKNPVIDWLHDKPSAPQSWPRYKKIRDQREWEITISPTKLHPEAGVTRTMISGWSLINKKRHAVHESADTPIRE